jgi:hypothetical protein
MNAIQQGRRTEVLYKLTLRFEMNGRFARGPDAKQVMWDILPKKSWRSNMMYESLLFAICYFCSYVLLVYLFVVVVIIIIIIIIIAIFMF